MVEVEREHHATVLESVSDTLAILLTYHRGEVPIQCLLWLEDVLGHHSLSDAQTVLQAPQLQEGK